MYEIILEGKAKRQLEKLSGETLKLIDKALTSLEINPKHSKVEKLTGYNLWRIRAGDYRIIFEVNDRQKQVIVYKIKHRREAYRKL